MKTKELMDYLSGFDPENTVSALIVNLETRQVFKVATYLLITDVGFPVMLFELGEASPMDEMVPEGFGTGDCIPEEAMGELEEITCG